MEALKNFSTNFCPSTITLICDVNKNVMISWPFGFRPSEKGPCDRKYKKHCKDDTGSNSPDGGKEEKSCDQQSGPCDQSTDVAATRTDDASQEPERPPNT